MSFDGNGVYSLPATTVTPAVSSTTIDSADFNTFTTDLETALSLCLTEDGQNVPTANLPMAGFKHTGAAAATATTDYVTYTQVGQLNIKVVNIGDWDMDASISLTVAHGLTLAKIRSVSGMIRDDADAAYYPLGTDYDPADNHEAGINSIDATNVNLARANAGTFDSTSFDSTSYNRGWIIIQYTD